MWMIGEPLYLNCGYEEVRAWLERFFSQERLAGRTQLPGASGKCIGLKLEHGTVFPAQNPIVVLKGEYSKETTEDQEPGAWLEFEMALFTLEPLTKERTRLGVDFRHGPRTFLAWLSHLLLTMSCDFPEIEKPVSGFVKSLGERTRWADPRLKKLWPQGREILRGITHLPKGKQCGAPRLEERDGVEEKKEAAREYQALRRKGVTAEAAAQRLGYSSKTLNRWAKRLLDKNE